MTQKGNANLECKEADTVLTLIHLDAFEIIAGDASMPRNDVKHYDARA